MTGLKFVVPGKPVVLQRARRGRGGHWYDPSAEDKAVIAQYAFNARVAHGMGVLKGVLRLEVKFYGLRPNGDVSNALKAVEDACNKVLYDDDKQISLLIGYRMPNDGKPRTEVELEELWRESKI